VAKLVELPLLQTPNQKLECLRAVSKEIEAFCSQFKSEMCALYRCNSKRMPIE
jgi:hypothetical protein